MFQWFQYLVSNKKSEIKRVSFLGNSIDISIFSEIKNCNYISKIGPVSPESVLLAYNPDLAIIIQDISFHKLEGVEILCFKNDEPSKKLALVLKKLFKTTKVNIVFIGEEEHVSLSTYKTLKRKLIIKPSGNEDLNEIIKKFLLKV